MSKGAALPIRSVNYPNVLGLITGGPLLNLGLLQVAVACRPPIVPAGQSFQALVFMQNASATAVDAVVRLTLPKRDLADKPGRFNTPVSKPVRVGLLPGEVAYTSLPFSASHQAEPGDTYVAEVEVQVEVKGRNASRVRDEAGGSAFSLLDIESARRPIFQAVMGLDYSTEITADSRRGPTANRAVLYLPFAVDRPTIAGLPQDLRPGFTQLWTEADYVDEDRLVEMQRGLAERALPHLNRMTAFFPLLRHTQERFTAAGYRLWAGEGVLIAKILSMALEAGHHMTVIGHPEPVQTRWFVALCTALARQPDLADRLRGDSGAVESLLTETLYLDLIRDACVLGFSMLATVSRQHFGDDAEMEAYIGRLAASLATGNPPLDIGRAYLPLVLAGLLVNGRVVMPEEYPPETVSLLQRALDKRADERNDRTASVFSMASELMSRTDER